MCLLIRPFLYVVKSPDKAKKFTHDGHEQIRFDRAQRFFVSSANKQKQTMGGKKEKNKDKPFWLQHD